MKKSGGTTDALDVPLAYFYTEDDELAELILTFQELPPEDKAEILTRVKIRTESHR